MVVETTAMTRMMSACGVLCSSCPAFHGREKGLEHQKRTAAAWKRIYRLTMKAEDITCGGCQGLENELLGSCGKCKAQQCCREKGFRSCADCRVKSCARLTKAQAAWDGVPKLVRILTHADFVRYAQPYCGHRERIEQQRRQAAKRR